MVPILSRRKASFAATAALLGATALTPLRPPPGASPLRVEILRDRYGVPNLFVDASGEDAQAAIGYAAGYAQAQDRLFQMDLFRRAASGRLAELPSVGAAFLDMDIAARRDGSTPGELAASFARLSATDQRTARAFRDGVNRFIDEVRHKPELLPVEYLGVEPQPWRETDTLAIGELELTRFAVGGGTELDDARLLAELRSRFPEDQARGIFDDLFWIDDPSAPTTIAPDEQSFTDVDRVQRFAPPQMALLDRFPGAFAQAATALAAQRRAMKQLASRLPIPPPAGHASNAIVVSGRLTSSGYPILLGGPQTGLNAPNFFWEVGATARDFAFHGVGVPGAPGISMGRTRHFAFSITSSSDDDTDVFAEVLDPERPGYYLHDGQSVPFRRRTETFRVAGQAPVTREFLRSVHGPVIFIDEAAGLAFSRARAIDGRLTEAGSRSLKLALARSLDEFRSLALGLDAGFNLHYADVDGNIAYVHAGRRPRRPSGTDPRLPLPGTGEYDERGAIAERPQVVNPHSGLIANWNNKPAAGWPCGDQREFWGPIDRVLGLTDGLHAELDAGRPFTVESVNAVMRHAATSDLFASRIVPFLSAAVGALPGDAPDRSRLSSATSLIEAWVADGAPLVATGDVLPHPGATLYREWRTQAQRLVFGDELGGALHEMFYPQTNEGNQEDDHGSFATPDALFFRALQGSAATLPLSRNYFADVRTGVEHQRDEALVDALRAAAGALGARFATDEMARWLTPKLLTTYMNLGGIDALFGATVQERQNRGSYNLLVELAPGGGGGIIVPPGESGALPSGGVAQEPAHLRDQLPLYAAFQYRRIPTSRDDIEGPVTRTTLEVPRVGAAALSKLRR